MQAKRLWDLQCSAYQSTQPDSVGINMGPKVRGMLWLGGYRARKAPGAWQ